MNEEMDWGSAISNEEEYIILPEGDYVFEVTELERARFPGGPKIKACPKAKLTLEIDHDGTKAVCRTDLILSRELEWKLCSFFRSIGMRKRERSSSWTGAPFPAGAEKRTSSPGPT